MNRSTLIATRMAAVNAAETMEMAARAARLRSQGHDILSLSQGEPDFATPEHIQEAAIRAMRDGKTRYVEAPGILPLRVAVTEKMQADHGLHYTPEQVTITAGAKQAIFNALFATLNPGDEVIIPSPCWVSYPEIVKLTGGTPVVIECGAEDGFKLTPEKLEAAITPQTKWLMLNWPSNPTGAVASREELLALGEVLERHPHVWIMTDEIYEKLIYTGRPYASFLEVLGHLQDRTLVINGVSKVYCMTGWRLGYAVGPAELIKAMVLVQAQSTNNTNSMTQHAAIAALTGDQSCVAQFRQRFHQRRDATAAALSAIPGLQITPPDGAFYAYVSCRGVLGKRREDGQVLQTDRDLVHYLLDQAQVAVVSGSGFLHSPYFRLSFAAADDTLKEAVSRIGQAIERLQA